MRDSWNEKNVCLRDGNKNKHDRNERQLKQKKVCLRDGNKKET